MPIVTEGMLNGKQNHLFVGGATFRGGKVVAELCLLYYTLTRYPRIYLVIPYPCTRERVCLRTSFAANGVDLVIVALCIECRIDIGEVNRLVSDLATLEVESVMARLSP